VGEKRRERFAKKAYGNRCSASCGETLERGGGTDTAGGRTVQHYKGWYAPGAQVKCMTGKNGRVTILGRALERLSGARHG